MNDLDHLRNPISRPWTRRDEDEAEARDIKAEADYYLMLDARDAEYERLHVEYDPDDRDFPGYDRSFHVTGMDDEDRTWTKREAS